MQDIESVLNEGGFVGRANWKGEMPLQFCPFHKHNFRSPSLSLNIKNGFKCYSCGAKGSIWRFLESVGIEVFNFPSISVDEVQKILDAEDNKDELIPRDDKRVFECAEFYHQYWADRGFDEQFCRNNRLGYNERRLRVTIPVYYKGKYYGSLQRTVIDEKPKYLIPSNFQRRKLLYEPITKPSKRYNVNNDSTLLITEGSIDSLKGNQYGYTCVATLGCLPSREQIKLILERPERKKILAFDNDEAGKAALDVWMRTGEEFHVLELQSKDLAESSKEEVDFAVNNAMDLLEYEVWRG